MLTRNSPNVLVEDKGNKKSKVTITKDHMVRIKVGDFIRHDHEEHHIEQLLRIAEKMLTKYEIKRTVRGSTGVAYPNEIIFQSDSRKYTYRVKV